MRAHPDSERRAEVTFLHATLWREAGALQRARAAFAEVTEEPFAGPALFWQAWCARELGHAGEARRLAAEYLRRHPEGAYAEQARAIR